MTETRTLESLQKPFRTDQCAVAGLCLRGLSHEADNMPVQDSFAALRLDNGWIALIVADGVGSEPRSDIGAQLAVTTVANHLNRFWGAQASDEAVHAMLHAAYQAACGAIWQRAKADNAPLHEYSTTLHTALFDDGRVYMMHAGDGGIAIMDENGAFRALTKPMKDTDGEAVVPLQAGPEKWQFSVSETYAQCVLVATDGFWDKLCPGVLRAYGYEGGMDRSIAAYFMSPWARDWSADDLEAAVAEEASILRAEMDQAVPAFYSRLVQAIAQGGDDGAATELVRTEVASGNRPVKVLRNIKDDTTALVLVRFDPLPQNQPLEYYQPPDWNAIGQWVRQRLNAATEGINVAQMPAKPASIEPTKPEPMETGPAESASVKPESKASEPTAIEKGEDKDELQ